MTTSTTNSTTAPAEEDCWIGPTGRLIPLRLIPARRQLEQQTVLTIARRAEALRQSIQDFRVGAEGDVQAFLEIMAGQYGVDRAGKRGGVRLESFDLCTRVEISVADTKHFGAELEPAKELIDRCIAKWTQGANSHLVTLINDAFKVGETGRVRVDRVLGLTQLEIDDPDWLQAMNAVRDAIRVGQSRRYVRIYTRPDCDAEWKQIVLDASRA